MAVTPSRIAEITPELEQVAQAAGCELVHAELKGGVLRLFVDKPEGVTLADCQLVSKQTSALLDVLDFGTGRYGDDSPLTEQQKRDLIEFLKTF